jgi:Tol biopolymer transport system component/DNA-binding winged helix-turn-helix (wHTH) protein
MAVQIQKTYQLGEFEIDPNKRLLKREDGVSVHLSNKPFQVLLYFVENRDRIVTRQELLDQFWDGRDVYDITLTKCVGAIRKALGENSEKPRFIETRWAEGYRYIGPFADLSVAGSAAASAVAASSPTLTLRRAGNAADQSLPETHAELSYNNTKASDSPQEVATIPTLTVVRDQPGSHRVAVPAHARAMVVRRWQFKAVLAGAVLIVLVLAAWTFFWKAKPELKTIGPDWSQAKSTQLTNQVGAEFSVNLAPDGKSFIYASRASGNWDLYWQRVGGRFTVNLTKDSTADDLQPAYSHDGNYIAFRSERAAPGIYVMEATSENVRRVSDVGFDPAWSPDGKEVVVSTDYFTDPAKRSSIPSQLWVINVTTGTKRLLTNGDAVQASWSPGGKRIAYWALQPGSGQRDIWTISVSGGEPSRVTSDDALDWNPVWSPDGKYLYFASDRGGIMNFWRVPLDETSGQLKGPPETVVTPSVYSQHLSFSSDGKRLAYVQKSETRNLQRMAFDPMRGRTTGEAQPVTQGTMYVTDPNLSPNEEWFACSTQGEKQEDILLIKRDGSEQRQLTDDVFRDRSPRWSPDGQRIAFYSDRSGRFEVWSINADGTGLHQITYTSGPSTVYPIWSPDGRQMLFKQRASQPFLFEVDKPWVEQTPQKLSVIEGKGEDFWANSWSADGRKLAGTWVLNRVNYLHVYDFETKTYENFNLPAVRPVWLGDNLRLLYEWNGRAYIVEAQTKKSHEILSADPYTITTICPTRDARNLYYTVQKTESDVWLLSLE